MEENVFESSFVQDGVDAATERVESRESDQDMLDRQALQEQENPEPTEKDPKDFTPKENFQEIGDVVGGIAKDLVVDTAMLPQSLYNLATGNDMKREDYWDPLGLNQWQKETQTETKWGNFLRQAGGLLIPIGWGSKIAGGSKLLQGAMRAGQMGKFGKLGRLVTASKNLQTAGKVTGPIQAYGKGAQVAGSAIRAGIVGETVTFLKPTQQENLFNTVKGLNPAFEALAIDDDDSPIAKKLKNMAEGFSVGFVADLALGGLGSVLGKKRRVPDTSKAGKAMDDARKIDGGEVKDATKRGDDIDKQITDRGVTEVDSPTEGAYKARDDLKDPGQGTAFSKDDPFDVIDNLNRITTDPNQASGAAGNILTAVQQARFALTAGDAVKVMQEVAEDILGSARVKKLIADATDVDDLRDRLAYSLTRTAEIVSRDVRSDEYWDPLFRDLKILTKDNKEIARAWAADNVLVADLVLGTLGRQIRDLGEIGLEVVDDLDVNARGSLIDAIKEKMTIGLVETKKARFLWSDEGRSFNLLNVAKKKKMVAEKFTEIQDDVTESLDFLLKLIRDSPNNEVTKGFLEMASTGTIKNFEDVALSMRTRYIKGSEGKASVLLKQLQDVMTNSILSGPKTVVRAILGTGSAVFLKPMATALGATMTGDFTTARASMAAANGLIQSVPDAFKLFRKKLSGYMSGDIATVRNRFMERTKGDENWEMFEFWTEKYGTSGDKAAFRIANLARSLNDNGLLTYSPRAMAAGDDAFAMMMARSRAREKAFLKSQEGLRANQFPEVTTETMKKYEDEFYNQIFDEKTGIKESFLKASYKESTLTKDLSGFAKHLETAMNSNPWTKPFFLFARTSVNGLELTSKYTPGLNLLLEEHQAIMRATPKDLPSVMKYGIESEMDLRNAKALMRGRMAIGSAVVFMAAQKFMNGDLRGNGPPDRQRRKLWRDLGGDEYSPRQIRLGGLWLGYDNIEPFGTVLSTIADIGDYSEQMGEEWTENQFQKVSMIIGQSITSKSYLQGLGQLVDLVSGEPQGLGRTTAGLINNMVPLSGLRNEIGKVINPYLKELNGDIATQIRARNQVSEMLTGDKLPIKYDILTGKPIQEYDFPTRMFNSVNPFSMNLDMTPGRKLLFESQYDLAQSVMTAPDSTSLKDLPAVRSLYQKAMGDMNLLAKLDKLAKHPRAIESLAKMEAEGTIAEPMTYYHNRQIKRIMTTARLKAWNEIKKLPEVQELMESDKQLRRANLLQTRDKYDEASEARQSALTLRNK